jgi:hypothetical protein
LLICLLYAWIITCRRWIDNKTIIDSLDHLYYLMSWLLFVFKPIIVNTERCKSHIIITKRRTYSDKNITSLKIFCWNETLMITDNTIICMMICMDVFVYAWMCLALIVSVYSFYCKWSSSVLMKIIFHDNFNYLMQLSVEVWVDLVVRH